MHSSKFKYTLSLIVALSAIGSGLQADQHADALKNYLTEDVVAVTYFDVAKMNPSATADLLEAIGIEGTELQGIRAATAQAEIERKKLADAGIRYVYVLLRASDLNEMGTSWVAPVAEGKNVRQAMMAVQQLVQKVGLDWLIKEFQTGDDVVLAAGNADQLKRLAENQPKQVRDLSAAWEELGSGAIGVVVFGDRDSRRVVAELFQNLPAPFETLTGRQVANDLKWGGIEFGIPPKLQLKLEIEAINPETAMAVAKSLETAADKLKSLPQFAKVVLEKKDQQLLLDALTPKVNQNRITVSLDSVTGDMERLTKVVAGPIQRVRAEARMQAEMNQLRQLALAILNYESAFSRFPNPSGTTEPTPAGLSWRVQILPFVEQNELYKQFKLDEPWNSEHNLQLVTPMPEIFKSPLLPGSRIHQAGKTIYQVPISESGIFKPDHDGVEGVTFRDLKDGSSNTIMIVAVAESEGAIWTKPDDWEVDLENPWQGLKDGAEVVAMSLADSSVHAFPTTAKAHVLRAMITANGGEIVEWPK